MSRKTINVCGHCGERKATDACVICDTDLCNEHQWNVCWKAYLDDRTPAKPEGNAADIGFHFGPFCPACKTRFHYKLDARFPVDSRAFMGRVTVAIENVGNAIARELFRGQREG